MRCLEKFKTKMNHHGSSLRNEMLKKSRYLIEETFEDDTSFAEGVYFWKHKLSDYSNETELKIRFYSRKYSAANGLMVQFQSLHDYPIDFGDIIYDSNNDEYWICTESFDINGIHWQGKFTFCNWILKWQNKKTGEIYEYPCYDANTTQYNSGETPSRVMTVGTSQHRLVLPYDENTVVIATPQRFYLDRNIENPIPYIVTQNDTTSYAFGFKKKGLVALTVQQHVIDEENDRPDLGICDYIDFPVVPDEDEHEETESVFVPLSDTDNESVYDSREFLLHTEVVGEKRAKLVILYNTNVIKSGGDSQVFCGKFYNKDGEELISQLNWEIICDFTDKLEVNQSGNYISIGIDNQDYIDEEFKLVLSDPSGNITESLIVKIESLI